MIKNASAPRQNIKFDVEISRDTSRPSTAIVVMPSAAASIQAIPLSADCGGRNEVCAAG